MFLKFTKYFRKYITSLVIKPDYIYIYLNKVNLLNLVCFLKLSSLFKFSTLTDIWASDFPHRKKRFFITYVFLSQEYSFRLFLRICVGAFESVPSLSFLYKSAAWLEREVWDMFGVFFTNNLDLRRILTDYGFVGHPLRKDFPLTGYLELRYEDSLKRIVYEPVEVSQEFRFFYFNSPWENNYYS